MDIIIGFNGLGNQMSQYAFYLQKKQYDKKTKFIPINNDHNGIELNRLFGINCKINLIEFIYLQIFKILITKRHPRIFKYIKKLLFKFNIRVINENFDYRFNENYLHKNKRLVFYYGGWHNEKYFKSIESIIRAKYIFPAITDPLNTTLINQINKTESVGIHVRRGDYLNENNINIFGKVCALEYYEKAINKISATVNNPHFFVFSNDINWVKLNLKLKNVTYIDNNKGIDSWKDMYLMTICKNLIIANSTFSWWGAWLNNENKIVISPKQFIINDDNSDIYPDNWIKLNTN